MLKSELVWKVKSLEYRNTLLNISIDHQNSELRVLKEAFDASERTLQREREEFKFTKDDNSTLKSSVTFISNENRNLRKQLADVKLSSHKALTDLNEEVRILKEGKEKVIAINSNLNKELGKALRKLDNQPLVDEVERRQVVIDQLEARIVRYQKSIEDYRRELKELKESRLVEPLIDANNKLKKELEVYIWNNKLVCEREEDLIKRVKELKEENVQINNLYKARGRSMTRVKEELNKWNSIEEEDKIISNRLNNYGTVIIT